MCSASATLASLPDWMIRPLSKSSTETCLPTSTNIFEPCMRQAFSLIVTISSSAMSPAAIALSTR